MDVRPAALADADRLGEIHVRAWQSAYRGELPDAYLDDLRAADRAEMWRRYIPRSAVVVSENEIRQIVGFASFGPSPDPVEAGELFAMNVDPDHWSEGHGSALLQHVVSTLATSYSEAVLWTSVLNTRAQTFYRRHGWTSDGSARDADVMGVAVHELRFRRTL